MKELITKMDDICLYFCHVKIGKQIEWGFPKSNSEIKTIEQGHNKWSMVQNVVYQKFYQLREKKETSLLKITKKLNYIVRYVRP